MMWKKKEISKLNVTEPTDDTYIFTQETNEYFFYFQNLKQFFTPTQHAKLKREKGYDSKAKTFAVNKRDPISFSLKLIHE